MSVYHKLWFDIQQFMSQIDIFYYMKSSDAKASKCHLKFSSRMIIFIKLVLVISLKWQ